MTITLKQAVTVNAEIGKRIKELNAELERVSVVEFEKGETYETPSRTIAQVEAEIATAEADLRKIEVLMAIANISNTLFWNNQELTLLEAILLNKQNRLKANRLARQASRKPVEIQRYSNPPLYVKALYDPEEKRLKAQKLTKIAAKLSDLIDNANANITINFDASAYIEDAESLED